MKKCIKYIILTAAIIGTCGFTNESHAIFDKLKKAAGAKCTDSDCGAAKTPDAVYKICLPDGKSAKKNSSCATAFWAAKCQDINSVKDADTIRTCYTVNIELKFPKCNLETAKGNGLDKNALKYCFDSKLLAQVKAKNQHVIDFYVAFWHSDNHCTAKKQNPNYKSQCSKIKTAIPDVDKRKVVTAPAAAPTHKAPAHKKSAHAAPAPAPAPEGEAPAPAPEGEAPAPAPEGEAPAPAPTPEGEAPAPAPEGEAPAPAPTPEGEAPAPAPEGEAPAPAPEGEAPAPEEAPPAE